MDKNNTPYIFIITTLKYQKTAFYRLGNSINDLDKELLDVDSKKIDINDEYIVHTRQCFYFDRIYEPLCNGLSHFSKREGEKWFIFPYDDLIKVVDTICKFKPDKKSTNSQDSDSDSDSDNECDELTQRIYRVFEDIQKKYRQQIFQECEG